MLIVQNLFNSCFSNPILPNNSIYFFQSFAIVLFQSNPVKLSLSHQFFPTHLFPIQSYTTPRLLTQPSPLSHPALRNLSPSPLISFRSNPSQLIFFQSNPSQLISFRSAPSQFISFGPNPSQLIPLRPNPSQPISFPSSPTQLISFQSNLLFPIQPP